MVLSAGQNAGEAERHMAAVRMATAPVAGRKVVVEGVGHMALVVHRRAMELNEGAADHMAAAEVGHKLPQEEAADHTVAAEVDHKHP